MTSSTSMSALADWQPAAGVPPLPESWVEELFKKMLLDYGKKFTDMWGAADMDQMITHWSIELAAFNDAELRRGWFAMERLTWPPSLPEFKSLCRPPIDPMVAFHEAQAGMLARVAGRMGEWSHRAIFWAALQLGPTVTEQLYSTVRPRWEKALADSLALGRWDAIPAPAVALDRKSTRLNSSHTATSRMPSSA